MKKLKNLKKLSRIALVYLMALLVSGSSLATAFATYGWIPYVPKDPEPQKVTVEHIWVDNNNKYTESGKNSVKNEDGSTTTTEIIGNRPATKPEGDPRPSDVTVDITANFNNPDKTTDPAKFQDVTKGENGKGEIFSDDNPAGITDSGFHAGEVAGKHDAEAGKDKNPGYDDGFNEGYVEGYKPDPKPVDPEETDPKPVDPEETDPKPADPEETNPKPADPEKPDSKPELPSDVKEAIDSVLAADKKGEDLNKADVDKITDTLLDGKDENGNPVKDQGNVWYDSKDYVAVVEDKAQEKLPVTYEAKLNDKTKEDLEKAGYDSVQLKVTVEVLYVYVWTNPKTGESTPVDPTNPIEDEDGNTIGYAEIEECPILVSTTHVSYDGEHWEKATEPKVLPNETVGEKNIARIQNILDSDESNDPISEMVKNGSADFDEYKPERDYVRETTFTFMHVLKDAETKTETIPPDGGDDDDDDDIEVSEDPVPKEEPPVEEEELLEEDVPLANVPETGDFSSVWPMLTMIAVTGLVGATLIERKKEEN